MSYRPFKRQRNKVDVSKLEDYDLFFEQVPPMKAYKLRRVARRNVRKLKLA